MRDLTGQTFGRLTVQQLAERKSYNGGEPRRMWLCSCTCGNLTSVGTNSLTSLHIQSCGCQRRDKCIQRSTKHGQARRGKGTPEYKAYTNAKNRCCNPENPRWKEWGGRGIQFRFATFENFYAVLGVKPSPSHSVDRYPDPNGHYEKENVRWATKSEQTINQRKRRNTSSQYKGVSLNRNSRWVARISIDGLERHLGIFTTEREAATAYNVMARLHNYPSNLLVEEVA